MTGKKHCVSERVKRTRPSILRRSPTKKGLETSPFLLELPDNYFYMTSSAHSCAFLMASAWISSMLPVFCAANTAS